MDNTLVRVGTQLLARVSGPMKFRLVLQPAMAAFFAIRPALASAKPERIAKKAAMAGCKTPYFWCLLSDPRQRVDMIKDGWKSVGRVFILAVVLDAVYQIIAIHFFYPGEALIVACILALLPYLILRGLVTRVARRKISAPPAAQVPPLRNVS